MASFTRKCRGCEGQGGCPMCTGQGPSPGLVYRPVTVTVNIQTDNRPARPFRMTVDRFGFITFTEKGRRKGVQTTAQGAFDVARKASARGAIKPKRQRRTVRRGLLSL